MTETKTNTEFDETTARARAEEIVALNHLGLDGDRRERLIGDIVWERRHAWTDGFQAGIAAAMEAMRPLADAAEPHDPVPNVDFLPEDLAHEVPDAARLILDRALPGRGSN